MELEKIREIIAAKMDIEPEKITEDASFEDMKIDSLDMVEIVMDIEDAFDVSIEAEENLKTVGDLVNFVKTAK